MSARQISGPVNYTVESVKFRVVREGAERTTARPICRQPEDVVKLVIDAGLIPDDARERFIAVYLSTQNGVVATHEVSVGTLSASLVHPREVFGPALRLLGVASIILVHNHPSGDPTPSPEDIKLTRQLCEAARLLELTIHDHVVIGNGTGRWVSLAQQGII